MKKDNLERFVRDNREAFDDKEPPGNLWKKIEAGLDQQIPGPGKTVSVRAKNRLLSGGSQIGWPIAALAGSGFHCGTITGWLLSVHEPAVWGGPPARTGSG